MLWFRAGAEPVELSEAPRPTGSTLPGRPTELRPPQGLYRYSGAGTDRLSTPPKEQAQGPEMPASVTHRDDGCWTFRIDYSSHHWQTWDYCPDDGGLVEEGGSTYQLWDFGVLTNESTSTFECDRGDVVRADQEPGETWEQSCTGTSTGSEGTTVTAGPFRFIGTDTVEVDGEEVPAYHYVRRRTMSGAQVGAERSEVWFATETGMPLRNERSIEVRTSTVIGDVTYTEQGDFRITSLEPVG